MTKLTLFFLIIVFLLIGITLYLIILANSKSMTDEERRMEDEEQIKFLDDYVKQREAKNEKKFIKKSGRI